MSTHLVKFSTAIGIVVVLIHSYLTGFTNVMSGLSGGISAGAIAGFLYEKWLWRINPLEKTPRLAKSYECTIEYEHGKGAGSKTTVVSVVQTLHSVRLEFETDEISSNATSAQFAKNAGSYYLEYVYATNPRAKYRKHNPAQNGAARLKVETEGKLHFAPKLAGSYWTTSMTAGDISLKMVNRVRH